MNDEVIRKLGFRGFSAREVCELVGISYRQIDYWARTDLIRPTLVDADGSGSRRRYGAEDIILLRVIKMMLDTGVRLETIRIGIEGLREDMKRNTLSEKFFLIVIDHKLLIADSKEELLEAVNHNLPMIIFPVSLNEWSTDTNG